jgi:hypothetical protein
MSHTYLFFNDIIQNHIWNNDGNGRFNGSFNSVRYHTRNNKNRLGMYFFTIQKFLQLL